MKSNRRFALAILPLRVLVSVLVCIVLFPHAAVGETKVVVRKKFIPKSYNWEQVRRVAILPIAKPKETAVAPGETRKWTAPPILPPDSVIQSVTREMVKQIKRLDSSIVVMIIDPLNAQVSQPLVMKIAGGATGANAIMEMTISDIEYYEAKPETPGPLVNGVRLPAISGRPAATRVRMSFTMTDPQSSGLIWQVDLEGKESSGGPGGSPDEAEPPSPEALLQELVRAAGSWLPF